MTECSVFIYDGLPKGEPARRLGPYPSIEAAEAAIQQQGLKTEQHDGEWAEIFPHTDAVPAENPDSAAARALDHQILQDLGERDQPNEQDER